MRLSGAGNLRVPNASRERRYYLWPVFHPSAQALVRPNRTWPLFVILSVCCCGRAMTSRQKSTMRRIGRRSNSVLEGPAVADQIPDPRRGAACCCCRGSYAFGPIAHPEMGLPNDPAIFGQTRLPVTPKPPKPLEALMSVEILTMLILLAALLLVCDARHAVAFCPLGGFFGQSSCTPNGRSRFYLLASKIVGDECNHPLLMAIPLVCSSWRFLLEKSGVANRPLNTI